MSQGQDAGEQLVDEIAARMRRLPHDYYHEMLAEAANGLELLCGSRHIRIFLSQPWFYGSTTPEVLRVAYIRGLDVPPHMRRPIWLERPHLKRGGTERSFLSAQQSEPGRCYLDHAPRRCVHQTSDSEESAFLRGRGIEFSLYLPIFDPRGMLGVAAVSFDKQPEERTADLTETSAGRFLSQIAPQLRAVKEYRQDKILKERTIDRALRRQRAYLLLRNLVKTGPADLAVALTTDPFLLVSSGDTLVCPAAKETGALYLVESYSAYREHKFILEEALSGRHVSELVSMGPARSSNAPALDLPAAEDSPLLKQASGPHPVEARWMREALPVYTHFLSYPLTREQDGRLVGLVLLFMTEPETNALRERSGIDVFGQFPNLEPVARDLVSVLVEPVSKNLVMDRLLSIYQLSQAYERYDRMKNIKEALSLYLHEALTQLAGLADADYGTVGVVTILENRAYVVVEKDTGEIVGAKAGDLQDLRVPALPVGNRTNLLSSEYSVTGVTAGTGQTTIVDDLQRIPQSGVRREFRSDVRSALAIPVNNANGTPVAVITLSSPRRAHFSAQTQAILESMAAMLSKFIENLIKKHKVGEAAIKLYGGRYPYIENDALRALADLYHAGSIKLAPFMDELLVTRNRRRAEKPSSSPHILLEDVERTYWQMSIDVEDLEDYINKADREIAESLFRLLKARKVTFQDAVQKPYTDHRLSRNVVRAVIALAREELQKPQITRVAALLNVCDPDYRGKPEERKKIEQFRQFYYRTVGPRPEDLTSRLPRARERRH